MEFSFYEILRMKRLALQKSIQNLQAGIREKQKTDDLSIANTTARIIFLHRDKRLVSLVDRYAGQMKPHSNR